MSEEEYGAKKIEKDANKVYQKVFDKIKTYNKAKLQKLQDEDFDKQNLHTDDPNCSEYAYQLCSMVFRAVQDDALPKLIEGEYTKDTKASEIKEITAESNRESAEEHYDEDSEIEGSTFNEVDVGTLPPRDLGLVTEEEEESVNQTSPDTIIESADKFLTVGKQDEIDEDSLNKVSNTVYNILLAVAIALAVVIGIVLGIKFMTSGAEGQAKIKEALIPYIVGCLIAFSAFGIWKVIIIILNNV